MKPTMDPLPEEGPLVMARENYSPTNADILTNTYKQNKAINYVIANMQTLESVVMGQGAVLSELVAIRQSIKTGIIWIGWAMGFIGLGGVATALSWFRSWLIGS